jgi:hypothetical protein
MSRKKKGCAFILGNHLSEEYFLPKHINFFKKNKLVVATFKNSCIFASAMETLWVH